MKGGHNDSYQLVGYAFDSQWLQDLGLVTLPTEREKIYMASTLILILVAALLVFGIEYITRGVPSPWRWVILAVTAVVLLLVLLRYLGMM
jgi:hypothetical protein